MNPGLKDQLQSTSKPAPDSGRPHFEVSDYVLKNNFVQGNVFFIHLNLSVAIEAKGLTPIQLVNEMLSMGEILDTNVSLPDLGRLEAIGEQSYDNNIEASFGVLYATVLETDLLNAALRLDEGQCRQVSAGDHLPGPLGAGAPAPKPTWEAFAAVSASPRPAPAPRPPRPHQRRCPTRPWRRPWSSRRRPTSTSYTGQELLWCGHPFFAGDHRPAPPT